MHFTKTLKPIILISLISFILTGCSGGSDDGESLLGGNRGTSSLPASPLSIESGNYRNQNSIDLTVTFIQPVLVRENTERPSIELTVGGQTRQAVYLSGSGTKSLVFRYMVQADDQDRDGIEVAEMIDVHDSEINYAAFANLSGLASNLVSLNVQTPTNLSSVKIVSGGNVELTAPLHVQSNANLDIPITFNEDVMVDISGGRPEIAINVDGSAQRAIYESGSGSDTLVFRYAVPQDTLEGEVTLVEGTIYHGERITYSADSVQVVANVGTPTESNFAVRVDNTAPAILSDQAASIADGRYVTGDAMDISVPFSEDVLIIDSVTPPSIALNVGDAAVTASYYSGSGTNTLIFRYIVESGHTNDSNPITLTPTIDLNDGRIIDRAGNIPSTFAFMAPTNLESVTVDATMPTITSIDIPSGYYKPGRDLNITLNISENIMVTGTPYMEFSVGDTRRRAEYVSGSSRRAPVFHYEIQEGENSSGIVLSSLHLNGGTIKDRDDNDLLTSFTPPSNLAEIIIDTTIPTINSVSIADGIYSTLDIAVGFSEPVIVDTGGGVPRLALTFGPEGRFATFVSVLEEDTLIFRYIVEEGLSALDGIGITSPLDLNNGSITDLAGNSPIGLSFTPPANLASVQVDTTAPDINTVTIPEGTYAAGGRIEISVAFREVITVNAVEGRPTIALDVGGEERFADYASGGGTDTLIFSYVVSSGESDENGISVNSPIVLNGGSVVDLAGNNAVLSFTPPGNLNEVLVDAVNPAINLVTVAPGNYIGGGNIDINVAFSKEVNITGAPTLSLRVGENDRVASYHSGGGTNTLVFRYTVSAGESDLVDGIEIISPLQSSGGSIRDSLGNTAMDLSFTVPSNLASVLVDAIPPTISSVSVEDGTYGGFLDLRVSFSEAVNVTDGPPSIALDVSGTAQNAIYIAGGGSSTLTFRYTVGSSDSDTDGIGMTASLDLAGGSITDIFGNALSDFSFSTPSNLNNVHVDGTVISIDEVTVSEGIYKEGEHIDIAVAFNRNVTVTGTPNITIDVGGVNKTASYSVSESGTNRLVFRYSVESSVNDDDGIEMTSSIDLNGGSIVDADSSDPPSDLNFTNPANLALVKVDTTVPTLDSVSIADGTYGVNLDISVVFSEAMSVEGGIPSISLTVDNQDRTATYESGSGSDTLIFRYVVQADESDLNGIGMGTSITLNSGTIADAGGNAPSVATATEIPFTAPSNLSSVFVDSVRPVLNSVSIADGTYNEHLDISVVFSESVIVGGTGRPSISLTVGNESRMAVYESGSGSDTLIFRYSVRLQELDGDGIEMGSSIDLGGGIIADGGGNIPVGGSATSLGFTAPTNLGSVHVDRVAPSILSVSVANGIYRDNVDISVVFSESVTAMGMARIPLRVNGENRMAVYNSGSGSDTLIFRYSVASGDSTTGGIEMMSPIELGSEDSIEDAGGNSANLAFNLPSNLSSVNVDGIAPTIDTVTIGSGHFRVGQNIDITVNFREIVNVVTTNGTPKIVLTVGSANDTRDALYNESASSEQALVFRYTVAAGDNDDSGIAMAPSVDLNGGTIKDRAEHDAVVTFSAPDSSQVFVDTRAPSVDSVTIASGNYLGGENLDITVDFGEPISITGGTPKISIRVGANTRDALYTSMTGNELTFRYTLVSEDGSDLDGLEITPAAIDPDGSSIVDTAGNAATDFSFTEPSNLSTVLVDATAPTVSTVSVTDGTYSGAMDITVVFSEDVTITGSPFIPLTVGTASKSAVYHSGSGNSFVFRYTVGSSDLDRDGIGMTASLDLAGGSIADTFGNILTDRTFSAPSNLSSVNVDGRITSITGVTVDSGHYKQGEDIDIEVTFNKAITVTGSPKIGIDVGGNAKFAVYNSIAANTLTFRYTVEANLNDADGIGMTTSINVSEGTITDSGSNAVSGSSLDFTEPANLALVKVDNTAPTIDSVTTVAAGTYLLGQHLDVTVNFNEDIVVDSSSGTPKIVLTVGSNDRDALYNETESTARALVFRYTVVDGDEDNSGGIGIASSIELEGGTIKDLAEHNAPTTITAPDSSQVLVDAAAPPSLL